MQLSYAPLWSTDGAKSCSKLNWAASRYGSPIFRAITCVIFELQNANALQIAKRVRIDDAMAQPNSSVNSNAFEGGYRLWTELYCGTTHKRFVH
jgi:hypothetical protein